MRLKTLIDCDSERIDLSPVWTESDWPLRFAIRVQYCEEYDRDWAKAGKYCVELLAVSPVAAGDELAKALDCCGQEIDSAELHKLVKRCDEWLCYSLLRYGTYARLGSWQGNNLDKLLREARAELEIVSCFTFGFRMDNTQNAMGATGWDFIAGNPLGSFARKES